VLAVAEHGPAAAIRHDPALVHGVNTVGGRVANKVVAEALGTDAVDPAAVLI